MWLRARRLSWPHAPSPASPLIFPPVPRASRASLGRGIISLTAISLRRGCAGNKRGGPAKLSLSEGNIVFPGTFPASAGDVGPTASVGWGSSPSRPPVAAPPGWALRLRHPPPAHGLAPGRDLGDRKQHKLLFCLFFFPPVPVQQSA